MRPVLPGGLPRRLPRHQRWQFGCRRVSVRVRKRQRRVMPSCEGARWHGVLTSVQH
uniref:Uncharacterized protein n=1 Tax=Arundo donax TaxID=35708 RepID=A0A0A9A2H5_ARUDO